MKVDADQWSRPDTGVALQRRRRARTADRNGAGDHDQRSRSRRAALHDPESRPGVAHLTGRVLDRAPRHRSADRIADELDDRGVALQVSTSRDLLMLSSTCLSEDFDDVLAIVLDVACHPIFPQRESENGARDRHALRQDDDNPAVRAVDALAEELYGPDASIRPQGQGHDRGDLSARSAPSCSSSTAGPSSPSTCVLTIVGDIAADRAAAAASALLDGWTAAPAAHVPMPAPAAATVRRRRHVDMPGKAQSDIAYGFTAIRRLDPRYHAYWMMNNILGQFGLGGRLADNIRERQGMAYYAYSSFEPTVAEGPLIIRAGVDPANVQRTIDAIDDEVRRFSAEGPTEAEMIETREYLIGSIPRLLETNQSIASFLQHAEQFGLGLDYDRQLPALIQSRDDR